MIAPKKRASAKKPVTKPVEEVSVPPNDQELEVQKIVNQNYDLLSSLIGFINDKFSAATGQTIEISKQEIIDLVAANVRA